MKRILIATALLLLVGCGQNQQRYTIIPYQDSDNFPRMFFLDTKTGRYVNLPCSDIAHAGSFDFWYDEMKLDNKVARFRDSSRVNASDSSRKGR